MTIDIYLGAISTLKAQLPLEVAMASLDGSEQEAASRIKAERRLNEFVYARHYSKHFIAEHLNANDLNKSRKAKLAIKDIHFKKLPSGKLYLEGNPLYFNITHSGDFIAFAISKELEIGLDIENPSRISGSLLDIAERYFTQEETIVLKSSSGDKQTQLFFNIWTLKEAVLKATGDGIVAGLDSIDVLHKKTPCLQRCVINQRAHNLALNYWHQPLNFNNTHLSLATLSDKQPTISLHALHPLD